VLFENSPLYGNKDVNVPLPYQKKEYKNMFQEELYTLCRSSGTEFSNGRALDQWDK
jgi:hypothetical protein